MKQTTRLILATLAGNQRKPISIREISTRTSLCVRCVKYHLRLLERGGLIAVDRREMPYSYEVSADGWINIHI